MVLADKIVLVEGPSAEIMFEPIFKDIYEKRPIDLGIDVLSMRGLSLKRRWELCAVLDKIVAAIRDNDSDEPDELRVLLQQWFANETRELFIGAEACGKNLESQLIDHNSEPALREVLGIKEKANLITWIKREKTEAALRLRVRNSYSFCQNICNRYQRVLTPLPSSTSSLG